MVFGRDLILYRFFNGPDQSGNNRRFSHIIIASGIVLKCGSPVRTRPDLLRAVAKTNASARPKSGWRFLCSAWSSPASLASPGTRAGIVELLSMASTAVLGSRRVLMNLLTTSARVTGEVMIEF